MKKTMVRRLADPVAVIRRLENATDTEYAELRDLLRACFPGTTFDAGNPLGRMDETWVASYMGKFIGTVSRKGNREDWTCVRSDWKGSGIAAALANTCLNRIRELGYIVAVTSMNPPTPENENFYRKLGYVDEAPPAPAPASSPVVPPPPAAKGGCWFCEQTPAGGRCSACNALKAAV